MASINASTKHTVSVPTKKTTTAGTTTSTKLGGGITSKTTSATNNTGRRGSVAPPLKASATIQKTIDKIRTLLQSSETSVVVEGQTIIQDIFRQVLGEHTTLQLSKPHSASTTRDRGIAAADLATITKQLSVSYVLVQCGILNELQKVLFPQGIESLLTRGGDVPTTENGPILDTTPSKFGDTGSKDGTEGGNNVGGPAPPPPTSTVASIKPSISALSLTSLVDNMSLSNTIGNGAGDTVDSGIARGKVTPPNAREGSLLLIRALIEIVGKAVEPYVVGAFLAAAFDECASSNSAVREAADDTASAIVTIANPYALRSVIVPLLLQSLRVSEWRTKTSALERFTQIANNEIYRSKIYNMIPILIPAIQNQVWDTKAQVSKAARTALLAICNTNTNADIRPTIPALVNAICKPSDNQKAISELMGTTFVVPVDASVLTILCPLLARALKEKLAIHKRAACIVITNMSKLVDEPQSIAPFGSLLVPELQRVAKNVQFEEIRDEALKALASLTKALGDHYNTKQQQQQQSQSASATASAAAPVPVPVSVPPPMNTITTTTTTTSAVPESIVLEGNAALADELLRENELVRQEQERIRIEREQEAARAEEIRIQEEEERKRYKEAMDAQRELDKIAANEAAAKRQADEMEREKQRLSTKSATGVCQGCGLKKCKKTCMFAK